MKKTLAEPSLGPSWTPSSSSGLFQVPGVLQENQKPWQGKKVLGPRCLPELGPAGQGQVQGWGPATLARGQALTAVTPAGCAENSRCLFMSPVLRENLTALAEAGGTLGRGVWGTPTQY